MSGVRAGRRRTRAVIAPVVTLAQGEAYDAGKVERAIESVADRVDALTSGGDTYVADVDLIVGDNQIVHGLGRTPALVTVTPATADASFAWGWDPQQTGARRDMVTTISVVGAPMTARVVVE